MKVVFSRALHIGKDYYKIGEQEVPSEKLKSQQFAKHVKAGNIRDASDAPRRVVVLSQIKRAEAFLEKLYGKNKANATPSEAAKLSGGVKSDNKAEAVKK